MPPSISGSPYTYLGCKIRDSIEELNTSKKNDILRIRFFCIWKYKYESLYKECISYTNSFYDKYLLTYEQAVSFISEYEGHSALVEFTNYITICTEAYNEYLAIKDNIDSITDWIRKYYDLSEEHLSMFWIYTLFNTDWDIDYFEYFGDWDGNIDPIDFEAIYNFKSIFDHWFDRLYATYT